MNKVYNHGTRLIFVKCSIVMQAEGTHLNCNVLKFSENYFYSKTLSILNYQRNDFSFHEQNNKCIRPGYRNKTCFVGIAELSLCFFFFFLHEVQYNTASHVVQYNTYLDPKFLVTSPLLWMHNPVGVETSLFVCTEVKF